MIGHFRSQLSSAGLHSCTVRRDPLLASTRCRILFSWRDIVDVPPVQKNKARHPTGHIGAHAGRVRNRAPAFGRHALTSKDTPD
jgi:hypothetical protein